MSFSENEIKQLNAFSQFFSYKPTWAFYNFIRCPHHVKALFTGNQAMKTSAVAYQYVLRIFSWHPVPQFNVLYFECEERHKYSILTRPADGKCIVCGKPLFIHRRNSRIFRFAAETLPQEKENMSEEGGQSKEIKNSAYPEFKKWLPPMLIKKDITFRNPAISIADPYGGTQWGDEYYPAEDIVAEFVSYNQQVQAGAGVQRMSVWEDEEAPIDFHEEQLPRLIAEEGDIVITLTPANRMTWTYDEIFERADLYIRTKAIIDYYKREEGRSVEQIEYRTDNLGIAVIQAATDDNPTLNAEAIDSAYGAFADKETIAIRRYGIHRQATGRVFKDFSPRIHVKKFSKLFTDGKPPVYWTHALGIDFHDSNPWAILWVALSPQNECFVWREWAPSPERFVNLDIAMEVASLSAGLFFNFQLIDPLAAKIQPANGISTIEDLNRLFRQLKADGVCDGRWYLEGWDTKGVKGRDAVRQRLKGSQYVGQPFNNKADPSVFNNVVPLDNGEVRLPTIWISDQCPETIRSLQHWRLEDWASSKQMYLNERKETPTKRFSHFCMCLEGIFKDRRFKPKTNYDYLGRPQEVKPKPKAPSYFRMR